MKHPLRYSLLLGTAILLGGGFAVAQMSASHSSQAQSAASAPSYEDGYPIRSRAAERFLAEFDLKKDGRVTHDEFNRTLAHEFSVATGGGQTMTLEQYSNMHAKDLRGEAQLLFRGMNWKGDGKLTLDEYIQAERSRFEYLDRDGTGSISCGSSRSRGTGGGRTPSSRATSSAFGGGSRGSGSGAGSGARGRSSICYTADLDKDGQVTRAEFDKANTQAFNQFAKGGQMNEEQFFQMLFAQSRTISERVFRRLDRDGTGKITLQEWAAPQERLFARLDKNNDGVVTLDELTSSRRNRLASRN
jgi:Ca2+-binding EF-hand superfamily protein